MEYELERTQLDGFELLQETALLREETLELIVPDACPDILRIIETDGTSTLKSKTTLNGRAELEGVFQLDVLYLPDGEEGVRQLPVTIPFSCTLENKEITPDAKLTASLHLCHADARAINPRKILARGEAAIELAIFAPVHEELSCQVKENGGMHLEQLKDHSEIYLIASVTEKEFEIQEQLQISAGKPAVLELLKSRAEFCQGESKLIGNKLIFKGDVRLCAVYRGTDQCVYTVGGEFPYSQIMEVSGVGEDADCELSLAVLTQNCRLDPSGEGRSIEVELSLLAQAVVRENRQVEILSDAYCTGCPVSNEWRQLPVCQKQDRGQRIQNVRELWETPEAAREVLDSRLNVGQLTQSRDGDRLALSTQVELDVLYLGEDGGIYAAQRQISVPCTLELPAGAQCQCTCHCQAAGEAYSAPAAGGIESRFALNFDYCILRYSKMNVLEAIQPGEELDEHGERPSLVLRSMEEGERLWDVAKSYQTTMADIMSANDLADEADAPGRLLLIPRKR